MRASVCLVVIYNHNYEKNIELVKRIYKKRFSHVFQVMPFYHGDDPSVIGVYENSYQYSGYIAQAMHRFVGMEYTHYVFIADDMVLNPAVNEENICSFLKLDELSAFHPGFQVLSADWFIKWPWGAPAVLNVQCRSNACEWRNFMPSVEQATAIFAAKGLDCRELMDVNVLSRLTKELKANLYNPYKIYSDLSCDELARIVKTVKPSGEHVYPLVRGFSDFFVVPGGKIREVCHACGVFAAMRAFVEVAIPTALVLYCDNVVTLHRTGMSVENGTANGEIRNTIAKTYNSDYRCLLENYPEKMLYIHPVKLSKWSNLP